MNYNFNYYIVNVGRLRSFVFIHRYIMWIMSTDKINLPRMVGKYIRTYIKLIFLYELQCFEYFYLKI